MLSIFYQLVFYEFYFYNLNKNLNSVKKICVFVLAYKLKGVLAITKNNSFNQFYISLYSKVNTKITKVQ